MIGRDKTQHHAAVLAALSTPRLTPFRSAADGDDELALRLYQWNVELSSACYEVLHVLEVAMRNAIDVQLAAWNSDQTDPETGASYGPYWLLRPAPLLIRLTQGGSDIDKARARATAAARKRPGPGRGRIVNHDDILANLTFGTWNFLLPDRDAGRQYLWREALSSAFPHLMLSPRDLTLAVRNLNELRNRIAHLEPVLDSRRIHRHLSDAWEILGGLDPAVEQWVTGWQRVTTVLAQRPRRRSRPSSAKIVDFE